MTYDLMQRGKTPVRIRSRCGDWATFERRFEPVHGPDGTTYWRHKQLPPEIDHHFVWTILDCEGRLYVSPGFHYVNRLDCVVCRKPLDRSG